MSKLIGLNATRADRVADIFEHFSEALAQADRRLVQEMIDESPDEFHRRRAPIRAQIAATLTQCFFIAELREEVKAGTSAIADCIYTSKKEA